MNDVIIELKQRREILRDELAKIDAAIEDYERWARSASALVGSGMRQPADDAHVDAGAEQTPVAVFEKEARALFDRASAPLKRTEVHEALAQAGVVIGGKNPLNTVASRLSRMEGITNIKGLGYWAEDRPYPPAGHPDGTASERVPSDEDETAPAETGALAEDGETPTDEA